MKTLSFTTQHLFALPVAALALLAACGDTPTDSTAQTPSGQEPIDHACRLATGGADSAVLLECGDRTARIDSCVIDAETNSLSCTDGTSALIASGADGADGTDGTDGMHGADGAPGRDGLDGLDGQDVTITSTPIPSDDPRCPAGHGGTLTTFAMQDDAAPVAEWVECEADPNPCDPGSRIVSGACRPVVAFKYTGELVENLNPQHFHPDQRLSLNARTRAQGGEVTACSGEVYLPLEWPESRMEPGLFELGALELYGFTLEVEAVRFERSTQDLDPASLQYRSSVIALEQGPMLLLDLFATTLDTPDGRAGEMSLNAFGQPSPAIDVPLGEYPATLEMWRASLTSAQAPRVQVLSPGPTQADAAGLIACELEHIFAL